MLQQSQQPTPALMKKLQQMKLPLAIRNDDNTCKLMSYDAEIGDFLSYFSKHATFCCFLFSLKNEFGRGQNARTDGQVGLNA